MSEPQTSTPATLGPLPYLALRLASLLAALGAVFLLVRGGSIPGAVLLGVLALAATAATVGGTQWGQPSEGVLDLSARLGLGLLGGLLGAGVSLLVRWLLVEVGLTGLMGVAIDGWLSGSAAIGHFSAGAIWGLLLGVVYPAMPAPTASGRGVMFSLLPSLVTLLIVFPRDPSFGLFGVDAGLLTFLFVICLNAVWGLVAGATVGWGETSSEAPVARAIGA